MDQRIKLHYPSKMRCLKTKNFLGHVELQAPTCWPSTCSWEHDPSDLLLTWLWIKVFFPLSHWKSVEMLQDWVPIYQGILTCNLVGTISPCWRITVLRLAGPSPESTARPKAISTESHSFPSLKQCQPKAESTPKSNQPVVKICQNWLYRS